MPTPHIPQDDFPIALDTRGLHRRHIQELMALRDKRLGYERIGFAVQRRRNDIEIGYLPKDGFESAHKPEDIRTWQDFQEANLVAKCCEDIELGLSHRVVELFQKSSEWFVDLVEG